MTYGAFALQMERLSGLKFKPASLQTHWEALQDLTEPLLSAAVDRAQADLSEFPSPRMLRGYADEARPRLIGVPEEEPRYGELREDATPLPVPRAKYVVQPTPRVWRYYCADCQDAGWRSFWCGETPSKRQPWLEQKPCGRTGDRVESAHYEHEWAEKCPCADTNPDVQRKRERYRQSGRRGETE